MQNLAKYPKQKYITSRKVFGALRKYDTWHETIVNTRLIHNCIRNEMNRLHLPLSYKTYKQFHKELNAIQTLFVQNGFHKLYNLPTLCNTRDFCTNSSNRSNTGGNSSKESSGGSDKDPKNDEEMKHILMKLSWVMLLFSLLIIFLSRQKLDDEAQKLNVQVPWNEFVHHFLAKGEVQNLVIHPSMETVVIVLHEGAVIKGERAGNRRYTLHIADINNLEEKIRKVEKDLGVKYGDGIPIIYNRTFERDYRIMSFLLTFLLILYVLRLFKSGSFKNPLDMFSNLRQAKFTLVEPASTKGVRFEDVAGLQEAKTEVMEFVDYLKRPERYKTLGAKVPKGALLLGPPGCGKTMLAKAVASESDVPFLSMNGSEFVEMIGGLGAARVRDLFKEGKKRAPSIIYIDEIDAIGKKRSAQEAQFSNSESERTLIQLLVEMDGMTTHEDVIILASTNRADVLDKALLRPGRFDRHILIDLPTLQERKQIFERHLKTLVLEGEPSKYSGYLAHLTPGFSGADIANICNEAALHAARFMKSSVDGADLTYAIDRVIAGPEKKTNTLTPSTKKVVAYHEAGHALVGWLLEHTDALLKVTIVPRTVLSLGFAQYSDSNQKLHSKEQLFERMCMMLGGRVAEYIMFDQISTGAENDLKKVTQTAYHQVQQYGMSSNIGLLSFDEQSTSTQNVKPYSKKLGNFMDAEVRNIIGDAYKATQKLLTDNKDKLTAIAEALLQKETLTYDDVEKLIGPPPFGKKRLVEPAEFEKSVTDPELRTPEPSPS